MTDIKSQLERLVDAEVKRAKSRLLLAAIRAIGSNFFGNNTDAETDKRLKQSSFAAKAASVEKEAKQFRRHLHLARGFLAGTAYALMETHCRKTTPKVNAEIISSLLSCSDEDVTKWLTAEAPAENVVGIDKAASA